MSKGLHENYFAPTVAGTIAGIVLAVGGVGVGYFTGWLGELWQWLVEPVSVSRLWYGFLLVFFILALAMVLLALWVRPNSPEQQKLLSYTEDSFFDLRWKWVWNKGQPDGITAFCPGCGRVMRYFEHGGQHTWEGPRKTTFECQHCGRPTSFDGSRFEVDQTVAVEIFHSVNTLIKRGS